MPSPPARVAAGDSMADLGSAKGELSGFVPGGCSGLRWGRISILPSRSGGSESWPTTSASASFKVDLPEIFVLSPGVAWSSGVLSRCPAFHCVAFEQFADAFLERAACFKTCLAEAAVGDNVIAFVWVLADGSEVDVKVRHIFLDLERQFLLRKVGRIETDIVRPACHASSIGDAVEHAVRDVPDVDEVALEVFLENHEIAFFESRIHEVI